MVNLLCQRVSGAFLLLAWASATGCGQGDAPEAGIEGDSLGVRVVVLSLDDAPRLIDLSGMEPGIIAGGEDDPIGNLRGLVWWGPDRIALADDDLSIRVYDAHGMLLARLGGRGDGPGEFRDLMDIFVLDSGGLVALDGRLGRITVFGPDGTVSGTHPLPLGLDARLFVPLDFDGGSRILGWMAPLRRAEVPRGSHRLMGMSRVFSWDLLSARWDSLVDVPVTQCRKEIASRCAPVQGSYSAIVRGSGRRTLVTSMDWPEVLHLDSAGELRELLRLREEGRGGFSLLLVEDEERIWVGYVGAQEWLVIERGVPRLARVKFPAGFSLRDIRDHVALGVLSDSLGVQQVATLGVLAS